MTLLTSAARVVLITGIVSTWAVLAWACIDPVDLAGVPITASGASFSGESITVHKGDGAEKPFTLSIGNDQAWFDPSTHLWHMDSETPSPPLDSKLKAAQDGKHLYYRKDKSSPVTAILDWDDKGNLFVQSIDPSTKEFDQKAPSFKIHQSDVSPTNDANFMVEVWQNGAQKGELNYGVNYPPKGFVSRDLSFGGGGGEKPASRSPIDLAGQSVSKSARCGSIISTKPFSTSPANNTAGQGAR